MLRAAASALGASVLGASVLGASVVLAACGGTSVPSAGRTTTTSGGATPPPSTPTTYGGFVGAASRQACLEDARLVQQASDYYAASHGAPAPSIGALVSAGVLKAPPATGHGYLITYDAQTGRTGASGACSFP